MASKVHQGNAVNPSEELRKQLDLAQSIGLRFIRRRVLLALTLPVAIAAFFAGPIAMPPLYASEAVLLYSPGIRSAAVLGDSSARGEPQRNIAERLCGMLFSANTLEEIILSEDLYRGTRAKLGMRDAVLAMRDDGTCRGGEANTIRVGHRGGDPEVVFRVTTRLTEALVKIASREGLEQAQKTRQFLEAEEQQTESALRAKEQERAEFLRQHPEFSSEGGATRPDAALDRAATLRRQAERLRRQLAAPTATAPQPTPAPAPTPELTPASRTAIAQAEATLNQTQEQLSRARARFTPQHPDVITAQNAVARAMSDLERARASAEYLETPPAAPVATTNNEEDQERMRKQLAELDSRLRRSTSPTASSNPEVEALTSLEVRWSELSRDLAAAQARHEQVAGRLFYASIIAKATEGGDETSLVMIDQPYRPARPSARGPRRTSLMAVAAAAVAWWVVVLGVALLDNRIYTGGDVERLGLGGIVHLQRRGKRRD